MKHINATVFYVVYTFKGCEKWGPYFDPAPVDDEIFLTCGLLKLTTGTLGNYVIEWRRGSPSGELELTSGVVDDPSEVTYLQENVEDVLVAAEDLYPVIRYMYVNGRKWTAYYETGAYYSPDFLTCLDPVKIAYVDCNTVYGSDSLYPFYLTYSNATDFSVDKSRTIDYLICPDQQYLAWQFNGEEIADQIKLYYYRSDPEEMVELLDNFIVGTQSTPNVYLYPMNLSPDNYPTDSITGARIYYSSASSYEVRFITDFSHVSYETGDFIRIEIVGSVYDQTRENTDWALGLKAIYASDITGAFYAPFQNSTLTGDVCLLYVGDPSCEYRMTYYLLETGTSFSKESNPYFIYRYTDLKYAWDTVYDSTFYPTDIPLDYNTDYSYHVISGSGYKTCLDLTAGMELSFVNSTASLVITCPDDTTYNKYVSDLSGMFVDPDYITYIQSAPDTSIYYYSYIRITYRYATSCGDEGTYYTLTVSVWCPIKIDPVLRTIEIEHFIPENNITPEECNDGYAQANSMINSFTNAKNITINTPSNVKFLGIGYMALSRLLTRSVNSLSRYITWSIYKVMANNLFDFTGSMGFYDYDVVSPNSSYSQYRSMITNDRATLLLTGTHEERLHNWQLERMEYFETHDWNDDDYVVVAREQTPTDLEITSIASNNMDLIWTDNNVGEEGYAIEYTGSLEATGFVPLATAAADSTGYNATGLSPDTHYWFRIRSFRCSASSYSLYSDATGATTASS